MVESPGLSLGNESKGAVKLVESGGYIPKSCAMIFELLACGCMVGVACVRGEMLWWRSAEDAIEKAEELTTIARRRYKMAHKARRAGMWALAKWKRHQIKRTWPKAESLGKNKIQRDQIDAFNRQIQSLRVSTTNNQTLIIQSYSINIRLPAPWLFRFAVHRKGMDNKIDWLQCSQIRRTMQSILTHRIQAMIWYIWTLQSILTLLNYSCLLTYQITLFGFFFLPLLRSECFLWWCSSQFHFSCTNS